jgi:1,4-alpha-glucan branching enzyme
VTPRFALLATLLLACASDASRLLDASRADLPFEKDTPAPKDAPADALADAAAIDGPAPDAAPRLGATPEAEGVTFRVWAPAASAATVAGDFGERAMTRADGGVFEARVAEAAPGQRYRFVLRSGDQTLTRTDPRAWALREGDAVVPPRERYPWRTIAFTPPRLREAVLYELHIGSFSVAPGQPAGSYASVEQRLDGLAELGVNVIQLMPVSEFGRATSWGYDPRLWSAANAAYGPPEALQRLIDEAHARGIAVLLDLVYNHYTGSRTAPLHCFDGDCPTGTSGVYFFRDAPYRSTPWGPRPDFARREVADCIVDSVGHWLDAYRVDGFRWDSVSNVRALDGVGTVPGGRDLMLRAHALTRAHRPNAIVIAEDLKGEAAITRPASGGGFGFDAQWDGFVYQMAEVLAGASDDARNMDVLRGAITGRYNNDPFQRIIGTENHDTVGNGGARFPQRVDAADPGSFAARKRSMLAAALAFTAPGVPMLFMGQEHLEAGTFASTPAPIDWSREEGHARVRQFYRALVRLRRNLDGASPGLLGAHVEVTHLSAANKVVAFRRWDRGGDDVVIVANLRNRGYAQYNVGLPAGGAWRVRLDSDDPRWSTDFRGAARATVDAAARPYDNQPFTGTIALGPWSVVVLSR